MDAEQIVRELLSALTGDTGRAADYLTDDFAVIGQAPMPVDKVMWLAGHASFNRAMPDRVITFSDVSASGNQVAGMVGVEGTHTGPMQFPLPGLPPVAPTGKRLTLPASRLTFTLRGDKIARIDTEPSPDGGVMGLLRQFGVQLPPPG